MSIENNYVNTSSGLKLIQDLRPGDLLLTENRTYRPLLTISEETVNKTITINTVCRSTPIELSLEDYILTLEGLRKSTDSLKGSFLAFAEEVSLLDFPLELEFKDSLKELSFCPFVEARYLGRPRRRFIIDFPFCCNGLLVYANKH